VYSVTVTEERTQPQTYSERQISEKLDQLISAWHEVEVARGALREFYSKYEHPPPPHTKVFEGAASLAEYHNAQARYSRKLEEVTERARRSEQELEEAASEVRSILPMGTSVFHNYVGRREEPPEHSGRYRLAHAINTIHVVKLPN
jgi:hypothetical protein